MSIEYSEPLQKIGAFFPTAREHIFGEMDLSKIDANFAYGYFWKSDRTSLQTTTEHVRGFEQKFDNYIKECFQFAQWALLCKKDELERLNIKDTADKDEHTSMLLSLADFRESNQYKRTKQLIQMENNAPATYAQGNLASLPDDYSANDNLCEVVGEDIPTIFSSQNSTREKAKKTSKNNLSTTFKTNAKKGTVGTGNAKFHVNNTQANVKAANGIERNLDLGKSSLFVAQNSDGLIKCDITVDELIKSQLCVGDVITVKFELTNSSDKEPIILENVVFFEIIEQQEEVAKKKATVRLDNVFNKIYATKDGRKYRNETTNLLPGEEDGFSINSGWHVVNNHGKLHVLINLDNPELNEKMEIFKTSQDKESLIQHWESILFLHVVESYRDWTSKKTGESVNIETFVELINTPEMAQMFTKTAVVSARYMIRQIEDEREHVMKTIGKAA